MSATERLPRLIGIGFDPLKDKSYQSTRLGRDIADFLAWCELGGMSPKTLVNYEPDLAREHGYTKVDHQRPARHGTHTSGRARSDT